MTLRDLCDGLEYQTQFEDKGMLATVERERVGLFWDNCLALPTNGTMIVDLNRTRARFRVYKYNSRLKTFLTHLSSLCLGRWPVLLLGCTEQDRRSAIYIFRTSYISIYKNRDCDVPYQSKQVQS